MSEQRPRFYFELEPGERARIEEQNLGVEEEGYVAIEINYGRRLASVPSPYETWPDLIAAPPGEDEPEAYRDPIAALLQAAVYAGHNAEDICAEAIRFQRFIFEESLGCISFREPQKSSLRIRVVPAPEEGSTGRA